MIIATIKIFSISLIILFSTFFFLFMVMHGGLSLEDDYCVLTVGTYEMHFSGYQPENNGPKEFCEDIPETGNTIVVLDFMNDELRIFLLKLE